jgi:hypothetical protein
MEKTKNLAAFKRIWSYVWPQWPRVVAILFWSLLMAVMLSASMATMIPVLKVMMDEEGLHGWVDRKVCNWRYGMDFYLPDKADFYTSGEAMSKQLIIVHVKKDSWAAQAGLEVQDRIVGVLANDGSNVVATPKMQPER